MKPIQKDGLRGKQNISIKLGREETSFSKLIESKSGQLNVVVGMVGMRF